MGLDKNGTRFLLFAHSLGVNFERTAMIGRQDIHLRKTDLQSVFKSFKKELDEQQVDMIFANSNGYAEILFAALGAKDVESFDKSDYEKATHLHDMNLPIENQHKNQYTTVLDGGSLEHIFNFSTAIKNCMEMIEVGGHYLSITPANNFLGHGFYQFSPELFYSIFTPQNGFEMVSMIAFEDLPNPQWYCVKNPATIKSRVTLKNKHPVYLLIIAKKIANTEIFATPPQQSDYLSSWENPSSAQNASKRFQALAPIKKLVPSSLKRTIMQTYQRFSSGFSSRYFTPMDPTTNTQECV